MDNPEKHLLAKIGQYVLIPNEENRILLLERAHSKNWSLPGGRLDKKDKDWKEALIREIKEETGLEIKNLKPFDVKLIEDQYQIKYCVFFVVDSVDNSRTEINKEHSSFRWIGKEDYQDLKIDDEPKVKQVLDNYFS